MSFAEFIEDLIESQTELYRREHMREVSLMNAVRANAKRKADTRIIQTSHCADPSCGKFFLKIDSDFCPGCSPHGAA